MRIYTKSGDLAFSTLRFPDGQPHFRLETYDREFSSVNIETALRSPSDLFEVGLATDILRQHGYSEINLDIRYLLAARMDRAISVSEPFSLQLVARWINSLGFSKVRILDVHSDVALKLIRNSQNVLPFKAVEQVALACGNPVIITPDKGAVERVAKLTAKLPYDVVHVWCKKERDMRTGTLSNFAIGGPFQNFSSGRGGHDVLIIDDICDGGGTFLGLAKVLREHGAKRVYLYVTHGIFSKGALDPALIEHTYTTNSFRDVHELGRVTTIPISMERL